MANVSFFDGEFSSAKTEAPGLLPHRALAFPKQFGFVTDMHSYSIKISLYLFPELKSNS